MTEYTASNGVTVSSETQQITGYRRIIFAAYGQSETFELSGRFTTALIESLDAEKDRDLGRWRFPLDPRYVVYRFAKSVRVVDEVDGASVEFKIDEISVDHFEGFGPFSAATQAYFEAHPERKPWEDAKPGEVWLFRGEGVVEPTAFMKSHVGWTNSEAVVVQRDPVLPYSGSRDEMFEPRRIWPEDAS